MIRQQAIGAWMRALLGARPRQHAPSRGQFIGAALGSGLALPLMGAGVAPADAAGSAPVTRITASVAVGQDVLVAVYDNGGSTGYQWEVASVAGIKVGVDLFPHKQAPGQPPLVGAPAIRVYHLTPTKAKATPYVVRLAQRGPGQGAPSVVAVVVTVTTHG